MRIRNKEHNTKTQNYELNYYYSSPKSLGESCARDKGMNATSDSEAQRIWVQRASI
jgi:hypothetical protein